MRSTATTSRAALAIGEGDGVVARALADPARRGVASLPMLRRLALAVSLALLPACNIGPTPCETEADCGPDTSGSICDPDYMHCTECLSDDDCIGLPVCDREDARCECRSDRDCGSEFCDRSGECVTCITDAHCPGDLECGVRGCESPRRD